MCAGHYVPTVMAGGSMHGELTGIHYTCRAVPGEWHLTTMPFVSMSVFTAVLMVYQYRCS